MWKKFDEYQAKDGRDVRLFIIDLWKMGFQELCPLENKWRLICGHIECILDWPSGLFEFYENVK